MQSLFLFILWMALFALPAWMPEIMSACVSVLRGLAAYVQRRRGLYFPLPTYIQERQNMNNKYDRFCASIIGRAILFVFYTVMLFGPVFYLGWRSEQLEPARVQQPRSDKPTAICNDNTYSYSQTRSGTCSHHGGVKEWLSR
jgi:hypothetical protein